MIALTIASQPAGKTAWAGIFIRFAEAAGEPVGAVALYDLSPEGAEAGWGRFVLDPGRRGRGWGRRSLELLIAHARALGIRRLRSPATAGDFAGRSG